MAKSCDCLWLRQSGTPWHLQALGFKLRLSIIPFSAPAAALHSTVNSWARENERFNLSFRRQSQVCYHAMCLNIVTNMSSKITPSLKHNHPCRPPSSAVTTDSATIEESTTSDLAIEKEGTAKYLILTMRLAAHAMFRKIYNMWMWDALVLRLALGVRQSEPLRRIVFLVPAQEILLCLQNRGGILDLWSLAEVTAAYLDRGAWLLSSQAGRLCHMVPRGFSLRFAYCFIMYHTLPEGLYILL
jgi:hypothetical protein